MVTNMRKEGEILDGLRLDAQRSTLGCWYIVE